MAKMRLSFTEMLPVGQSLLEKLKPSCCRIELAGSLRRVTPTIGDIEIVCIPKTVPNLVGEPCDYTEVDQTLDGWPIKFKKRGNRYKQFSFQGKKSPYYIYVVDLFLATPENFGLIFMIRTGPAAFSRRMVTSQEKGGLMPNKYTPRDGRLWQAGQAINTPEEEDIFRLYDLDYIDPQQRGV